MIPPQAMDAGKTISEFAEHFSYIPTECPYGLGHTAVYQQGFLPVLSPRLLEQFLAAGFRRNGNTIYAMHCMGCTACVPIRLETETFRRSRNMQRVWRRNRDLQISIGPLAVSREKLALCDRFLQERYPGRHSTAADYYSGFFMNSLQVTVEISFRLSGRLVGLSVVDLAEESFSAVYFCFAPDLAARSLGTFNVLFLAGLAARHKLKYVYLGYWIKDVAAMAYKSRFRPHFLLIQDQWRRVE